MASVVAQELFTSTAPLFDRSDELWDITIKTSRVLESKYGSTLSALNDIKRAQAAMEAAKLNAETANKSVELCEKACQYIAGLT